ncbi:MBL fold metallo-hydrolase [Gloeobacter kilaueensis]|uniref:Zn-dependent hydrolases, including glyoxylase n=1 Tax=Gloeobacter kilaueensis (strain ATCC BAA-2537 / CCAP 1431/1 / ULC 316 / JS1) TaxID=1183438 RepID=U5QM33_GLOK1|nr:MBL fold metallo-hydrolase [Gloeobacter kilaueensis]AGY59928.1 Zn-dependent hydrolases, including glyoxylase [Gloeobacter kilaueensis JS1]
MTTREIFGDLLSFKPNRHTLGGTSYLLVATAANGLGCNWLVDCPAWSEVNRLQIEQAGGIGAVFVTHRGAIGELEAFCRHFQVAAWIQEQEAYLLLARELTVHTFAERTQLDTGLTALWTPGHSPGSSCLLWQAHGGVLFSGRHLLPDGRGNVGPVQTAKTFHWPRQLASAERLGPLNYRHVCPGAAVGLLRGQSTIVVDEREHRSV